MGLHSVNDKGGVRGMDKTILPTARVLSLQFYFKKGGVCKPLSLDGVERIAILGTRLLVLQADSVTRQVKFL